MPAQLEVLRQKRDRVLQDMQTIDRLRRGTLSQQFFKPLPGQTEKRGPYFILQGHFQGKKFSERIPSGQAPQVQAEVDNFKRFQSLAEEYITLSDEMTRRESSDSDSKKNSSRRKSPTRISRKPKPS